MIYKKYPENKPETDCECMVLNTKGWMISPLKVLYNKRNDCFIYYSQEVLSTALLLEVTHFFELPSPPEYGK